LKTGDDYPSSLISAKMENKVMSGLLVNVIIRKCAAIDQLLFEHETLLVNGFMENQR
jgi:hypothetical protein